MLGITGSIAAYKSIFLVRSLVKAGAEVKVIMTPSAKNFVSALTLSTLSKNPVLIDLFDGDSWNNHVLLGRWADAMLLAPLSCNTLSKMASGACDNLLMAVYLSATCPVFVAPAMDEDMWLHSSTKENIEKIKGYGCTVLPVERGELASGLTGEGRMAEPELIIQFLNEFFVTKRDLKGKKALVTAGPTYEPIDPVRFIGNHSSGKMGYALADELCSRGADVVLVSGPVAIKTKNKEIKVLKVQRAEEMYEACLQHIDYDIAIMAAAVADFTPVSVATKKIKKGEDDTVLTLRKTPDILSSLGNLKKEKQVLIGFALETDNEFVHAQQKLNQKKADFIVLNSLKDEGAGFKTDTNRITLLHKSGLVKKYEMKPKALVAKDIIDAIIEIF